MSFPTFTLNGESYAVVPKALLAELGLGRPPAAERRRRSLRRKLRLARKHAGLSQAALAERLGCTQAFVSTTESGSRRVGERYLARVLDACDLPPGWSGA